MHKYTREELKQVAMDYVDCKIFTNFHLRPGDEDMIGSVFMPLLFMSLWDYNPDQIKLVYEYYDKQEQRSINGYPIFMSMRLMSKEDFEPFKEFVDKYQKVKKEFAEL